MAKNVLASARIQASKGGKGWRLTNQSIIELYSRYSVALILQIDHHKAECNQWTTENEVWEPKIFQWFTSTLLSCNDQAEKAAVRAPWMRFKGSSVLNRGSSIMPGWNPSWESLKIWHMWWEIWMGVSNDFHSRECLNLLNLQTWPVCPIKSRKTENLPLHSWTPGLYTGLSHNKTHPGTHQAW